MGHTACMFIMEQICVFLVNFPISILMLVVVGPCKVIFLSTLKHGDNALGNVRPPVRLYVRALLFKGSGLPSATMSKVKSSLAI